jgi:tRNA nucleotidyltransferase (CCA-adding enzyme)
MQYYQVGGAVRDEILGLKVKDRDWVVVGARPAQMQALGFKPVGKDFPVFLHPETHEEYALARTERKTAPGYHGFTVHAAPDVTLEQDLQRRDLTINAMARDESGRLIDPYGGASDLQNRLLRHVSPAFAEDPVRVLRLARFAARYADLSFSIAAETQTLLCQMVERGEVDALVPERVWAETVKALAEPWPRRYIEVLRECGALVRILPELDALFGVPQVAQHHPEIDTGIHVLMALDQVCALTDDTRVRFAVLMHDLGKGLTDPAIWPHHYEHEKRGAELLPEVCQRLRTPKEYRDLAVLSAELHTHCHRALELRPSTVVKLLERLDAFRRPQRFEQFLLTCEADARGRLGLEQRDYPQTDYLRQAFKAAEAVDIRALAVKNLPGPEMAQVVRQARVRAVASAALS